MIQRHLWSHSFRHGGESITFICFHSNVWRWCCCMFRPDLTLFTCSSDHRAMTWLENNHKVRLRQKKRKKNPQQIVKHISSVSITTSSSSRTRSLQMGRGAGLHGNVHNKSRAWWVLWGVWQHMVMTFDPFQRGLLTIQGPDSGVLAQ